VKKFVFSLQTLDIPRFFVKIPIKPHKSLGITMFLFFPQKSFREIFLKRALLKKAKKPWYDLFPLKRKLKVF
jgi:hypothetical protein